MLQSEAKKALDYWEYFVYSLIYFINPKTQIKLLKILKNFSNLNLQDNVVLLRQLTVKSYQHLKLH